MSSKYDITKGKELIHPYFFTVEFTISNDKYYKIGFSKISSIQNNVEYETIIEGNGSIHLVPKYISQPKVITFSKGISSKDNYILQELYVGKPIKSILVTIGDTNEQDSKTNQKYVPRKYTLENCVITKYNTSEIDALSSNILWENFEITYTDKFDSYEYDEVLGFGEMFD